MNKNFTTRDLNIASLCYAKGLKLLEVKRSEGICWFVFEGNERCLEIQNKYFAKSIDVNAKEFADSLRTLKDLVFS